MRVLLTEQHFPFVSQLEPESRRELHALSATRVQPKQRLLQRGEQVEGAYLVVVGSLRVFYITASGREATLYHVEPGGTCILALTAAFQQQPYPAWAEADDHGGAFVHVPQATLRRLLDREAAFRDFVFGVLSARVFELMQTLEQTSSEQVEQRVARFLVRHVAADSLVRQSQRGIAAELGTAREVVFRALRGFSTRGWIQTSRARIAVLDLEALQRISEGSDERGVV